MKKILIILTIVSTLISSSLGAFDTKRKGGYISFGIGIEDFDYSITGNDYEKYINQSAIATSIHIGYGFSDDFLLYYSSHLSWYFHESDGYTDIYFNGIRGIGITYYVEDRMYLRCAYGLAYDETTERESSPSLYGNGYELGIGYNISKNVSIELNYENSYYDELKVDGISYSLDDYGVSTTSQSLLVFIRFSGYINTD